MFDEHEQAIAVDEAEKVLDMEFAPGDQPAVVLHPGEESLNLPSTAIAAQRTAILCLAFAAGPGERYHLDAVFIDLLVERVRVVGFVTDEPLWQLVEEASGQKSFHNLAVGRRSAFDGDGERKTVTRGDCDDLGSLTALGGPTSKPPIWRSTIFRYLANCLTTPTTIACMLVVSINPFRCTLDSQADSQLQIIS